MTYGGTVNWSLLRPRLTDSVADLIVADFNGNGRADIATAYGVKVAYDGRGNWTDLPARPGMFAAIGRFDANPGADILFFWGNANYLGIQSSGLGAPFGTVTRTCGKGPRTGTLTASGVDQ